MYAYSLLYMHNRHSMHIHQWICIFINVYAYSSLYAYSQYVDAETPCGMNVRVFWQEELPWHERCMGLCVYYAASGFLYMSNTIINF